MIEAIRDRPIFICGHPKSGTSLVRSLLDSHPQLVVYPEETVFFRSYLPAAQGLDLEEKIALGEQRLIHIFTWNTRQPPPSQKGFPDRDYSAVPYEAVRQAFRELVLASGPRHDGDLLCAAVLAFGQVTGHFTQETRAWVEKSPYNERYADQIYTWWPEARCIHIVRDPRDNYLSYRRKHPEWSGAAFATNWAHSTRLGLANQARYGDRRYRLIRYERLVAEPQATLEELRAFLEIAPHPILEIPTRAGQSWGGNSMFAVRFEGISPASVGRWKQRLSAVDAGVIQLLAGRWMGGLGYEPAGVPLTAFAQAVKWIVSRKLVAALQKEGA